LSFEVGVLVARVVWGGAFLRHLVANGQARRRCRRKLACASAGASAVASGIAIASASAGAGVFASACASASSQQPESYSSPVVPGCASTARLNVGEQRCQRKWCAVATGG
jgi:hypothetical protein